MSPLIKADVYTIIENLKSQSCDAELFYNHIHDGTLDHYYLTVLAQVASDLLALPVERAFLELEPLDPQGDVEEVTQAVMDISLLMAGWFLKDASMVERDLAQQIQKIPAEDIREARFLLRHHLLH